MSDRSFAPATERNRAAILEILRHEFAQPAAILEIGSGTGQHAVYFGAHLDHLMWQTSDVAENHAAINAWLRDSPLPNVLAPLRLDVLQDTAPQTFDNIYSANTAHIMSIAAVEKMFKLVSSTLPEGGKFVLYGPFRQDRLFNTPSNESFHRSLRDRDPSMGIRHLEDLDELALAGNMRRQRLYAMPANNHIAVWRKGAVGDER